MAKKEIRGRCALCDKDNVILENSHIIPKFVMRFLKESSIGKIRTAGQPNAVAQDSEKHYLLCGECEDKFNIPETLFASKVFRPFQYNNFVEIEYEDWLYYFITSVSWRSLILDIKYFEEEGKIHLDDLNCLKSSAKIMKEFLMGRREDISPIQNHIFFFQDLLSAPDELVELQPHLSILGSQGGYTVHNHVDKTHGTITNMLGILIFSLYAIGKQEKWENTEILPKSGKIGVGNQHITSAFGMEIQFLAESLKKAKANLSDKTKANIAKTIEKNKDKLLDSRLHKIKQKDFKLKFFK